MKPDGEVMEFTEIVLQSIMKLAANHSVSGILYSKIKVIKEFNESDSTSSAISFQQDKSATEAITCEIIYLIRFVRIKKGVIVASSVIQE